MSRISIVKDDGQDREVIAGIIETWDGETRPTYRLLNAQTVTKLAGLAEVYFERFPEGRIILGGNGMEITSDKILFLLPPVHLYAHDGTEYVYEDVYIVVYADDEVTGFNLYGGKIDTRGRVNHPHTTEVEGYMFCTGFYPRSQWKSENWDMFIDDAVLYASTYTPRDAFRVFPEDIVSCGVCDGNVRVYNLSGGAIDAASCSVCGDYACELCYGHCKGCDEVICKNCSISSWIYLCSEECLDGVCLICQAPTDEGGDLVEVKVDHSFLSGVSISSTTIHKRCASTSSYVRDCASCGESTATGGSGSSRLYTPDQRFDVLSVFVCSDCEGENNELRIDGHLIERCPICSTGVPKYHPADLIFSTPSGDRTCVYATRTSVIDEHIIANYDNVRESGAEVRAGFDGIFSFRSLIIEAPESESASIRTCFNCGRASLIADQPEEFDDHMWFCDYCGDSVIFKLADSVRKQHLDTLRKYHDGFIPMIGTTRANSGMRYQVSLSGNEIHNGVMSAQRREDILKVTLSLEGVPHSTYFITGIRNLGIDRLMEVEEEENDEPETETEVSAEEDNDNESQQIDQG